MAAPRKLPDETVLERWYLREKLTYKAMAERWANTPGGHSVSAAAFSAACHGAEWFEPRNRSHVGTEYWPWLNVRPEHNDEHDAQMLRLYGRRKAGDKSIKPRYVAALNAWLRGLYDENAVIAYKPNTNQGWWHVKKEAGDVDIVRWPEEFRREKRRLTVVPEAG